MYLIPLPDWFLNNLCVQKKISRQNSRWDNSQADIFAAFTELLPDWDASERISRQQRQRGGEGEKLCRSHTRGAKTGAEVHCMKVKNTKIPSIAQVILGLFSNQTPPGCFTFHCPPGKISMWAPVTSKVLVWKLERTSLVTLWVTGKWSDHILFIPKCIQQLGPLKQ